MKLQVMATLKTAGKTSTESTANILATAVEGLPVSVLGKLPPVTAMKRNIQRTRQETLQGTMMNASNRSELVLHESFTELSSGEQFLKFDSGNNNQRILIFSTDANLEQLSRSKHWYADGTFKTSPSLFNQFFVIHGSQDEHVFPLVYILTPNRTRATYDRVLQALKNLKTPLQPETIMTDFELASLSSFASAFPESRQRGCFFHFSQCLWRRIQEVPDILQNYSTIPDFALNLKQIAALAFIPPEDVPANYDRLMDTGFFNDNDNLLQPLMAYVENTWIGGVDRRKKRREPMFAITLWNCYESVLTDLNKTNNCEGFNNGFHSMLGATHPSIFKFIDGLKKQQALTDLKREQLLPGSQQPVGRNTYKITAAKLKNVVEEYGTYKAAKTTMEYLRGPRFQFDVSAFSFPLTLMPN